MSLSLSLPSSHCSPPFFSFLFCWIGSLRCVKTFREDDIGYPAQRNNTWLLLFHSELESHCEKRRWCRYTAISRLENLHFTDIKFNIVKKIVDAKRERSEDNIF